MAQGRQAMKYQVTKTISPEQGWSAAFRQWKAESHCSFIHGYALGIEMVFEAETLDDRNWVISFGDFGPLKERLAKIFDHKTLIALDDPEINLFHVLHSHQVIDLVIMPKVGCEAFAEHIAKVTQTWLAERHRGGRVRLVSVEVREHGSNAAKVIL
jgi:6-pyruvoyltetrahydropterin/6-carboxytetrahydropterin synthase